MVFCSLFCGAFPPHRRRGRRHRPIRNLLPPARGCAGTAERGISRATLFLFCSRVKSIVGRFEMGLAAYTARTPGISPLAFWWQTRPQGWGEAMANYWGLVVRRAIQDSTPFVGRDPRRIIARLIVGLVAIGLLGWIGSKATEGRIEIGLAALAAFGIVALAILLYNLCRAPDRIHREQLAFIKNLESRIERRRVAQEHIDAMRAMWSDGQALFKAHPTMDFGQFQRDALDWFDRVKSKLKEFAEPGETWMFETIANLRPPNNAALALEERLGKLRMIVDRMIHHREAT